MGYIISIIMFMSIAMGAWFINKNQILIETTLHYSQTDAFINHLKIYADSIETFIKIKPLQNGVINDNQLTLPSWFNGDQRIKKQIFEGRGYLYLAAAPGLLEALHQTLQGSLLLGKVDHQVMVHLTEGKLPISLPPDIPDGYIVYVI